MPTKDGSQRNMGLIVKQTLINSNSRKMPMLGDEKRAEHVVEREKDKKLKG